MSSRKVNRWGEWEWSDTDGCWVKFLYDKHGRIIANEHHPAVDDQPDNVPRGTGSDVEDLTAGFSNVNITGEPYSDAPSAYHDSAYTHAAQNTAAAGGLSHEYAHASTGKSSSKSKSRSKAGGSSGTDRPPPSSKIKVGKKSKDLYQSEPDQRDPFYTYPPTSNYPPSQRETHYHYPPPDDVNDTQGEDPTGRDDSFQLDSSEQVAGGNADEYYKPDPTEVQEDPYAHSSTKHKGKGVNTEYYEESLPEPQEAPYAHSSRKHKGKGATAEYYEEDPSDPQENAYLHGSRKNKGKGVEHGTAPGVRFDIAHSVPEDEDEDDEDEDGELRATMEASRRLYNSGGRQSESSAQVENDYEDAYEYGDEHPIQASTGSEINMKHDVTQPGYQDYFDGEQQDIYSKRSDFIQGDPTTGTEEQLDPRFVIQPSHRFQPGVVFKVLWSEPHGGKNDRMTDNEIRTLFGERFYICFRRFVVVANDEGHCTCVPILTYERRGCNKKGVKPAKHGIVHALGSKPRLEPGEPTLGFRPVRLDLVQGEKLASQSRINYSKLVTIEHNVKVFFIGSILSSDFEKIVSPAVDHCWSAKNSGRRKERHRK